MFGAVTGVQSKYLGSGCVGTASGCMDTLSFLAASAGDPPAYAVGECVYLAGKSRLLDNIDEYLMRSYLQSSYLFATRKRKLVVVHDGISGSRS